MFRSYAKKIKDSLRVKHEISEVNKIFIRENMENTPPEFRMWFRVNFMSGVLSSKTRVFIPYYHMTRTAPRAISLENHKKKAPV